MAIGGSQRRGGMTDGAVFHDGREQLEKRIAELRAALLAGLEGVSKVYIHTPNLALCPQKSTLTEASTVRGAPRCATRFPVLVPVRLLGAIVDQ